MKKSFLAIPLTVSLLLTCSALAADKGQPDKAKSADKAKLKQKQLVKREKVAVTGSYIKEEVRPDGTIRTGPSPLHIIDSESIRNSGSSDIAEVLIKRGYNR